MLVRDVMTTSPTCCMPDDTLDRVAALMLERDCGAIPVCDGSQLVGMITDRDITCRVVAAGKIPVDAAGRVIGIVAPSDLAPTFASGNVADFLLAVSYWNHKAAAPATLRS